MPSLIDLTRAELAARQAELDAEHTAYAAVQAQRNTQDANWRNNMARMRKPQDDAHAARVTALSGHIATQQQILAQLEAEASLVGTVTDTAVPTVSKG